METSIHAFNHAMKKSHMWLKELTQKKEFRSEEEAYSAMRAVLHALRDRLIVNEAAQLASQLPTLIRGVYFDGWKPSATPVKERSIEEFLNSVAKNLRNATNRIDPDAASRKVFQFLNEKISEGEIEDIKGQLPKPILTLWEEG